MKILFVTPGLPSRYEGGGGQRMYYMIKYLTQLGVDVHLLSLNHKIAHADEIHEWCRKVYLVKRADGYKDRVKNFLSFKAYTNFPDVRQVVGNLNLSEFDLIHVHKFQMAEYFKEIEQVPVVIDLWACGLRGSWYEFLYEKNMIAKLVKLSRIPRYYLADRKYYRVFSRFFVVSPEAKDYVQKKYPAKKVYIIPNGILPQDSIPHLDEKGSNAHDLVFTGDMSFFQNIDTVKYFAEKIFPLVRQKRSDVKFYIVGKNPVKDVIKLAGKDPSIIVTGFVKDISEYLKKAALFVAPIRTGSGIRNKILEAMSWGIPVVTTYNGKEGIQAENGKSIVLSEKPKDFARRIIELLQTPHKRAEIGQAGRSLVHEKYQWQAISENIKLFYQDIIQNFCPHGIRSDTD